MEFRDRDGYFHQDVFRVLGRATGSEPHALTYNAIGGMQFVDEDGISETSSETSTESSVSQAPSFDLDAEWEDAKQVLYTTFVGFMLPFVFRYVGRRLTFAGKLGK
ncbi:hypothetical protein DL89DRAFT_154619 [Linderina pennispora]|uniref:Uncharacterized protein n=1 Tax=Linderina pennispora TaxID=61395 RepID=A0A1Y1W9N6_9FUNG|nr:uncharacterized protein DL89DRAFT_154619 [Linderina pennispora]ORX70260.1 hypothetical protein DL89DRAFT_154619 [Linderina pennispora]